jgi:hypothetical protein
VFLKRAVFSHEVPSCENGRESRAKASAQEFPAAAEHPWQRFLWEGAWGGRPRVLYIKTSFYIFQSPVVWKRLLPI